MDAATPPETSAPGGHSFPGPRFGAPGPRSGGHGFPGPHIGGKAATAPRWAAGPAARPPMPHRRRGWLWAGAIVAAIDDSARVDTAYLTAGPYFYFLDQQHADYRALLTADGTTPFVKEVDAIMPPGLRIADWQAWMAEQ